MMLIAGWLIVGQASSLPEWASCPSPDPEAPAAGWKSACYEPQSVFSFSTATKNRDPALPEP